MGFRRRPVASDRRLRANRGNAPDYGTRERWNHSGRVMEIVDFGGALAARALEERALDVLVLRGDIKDVHREAALRMRRDFSAAGLAARTTCGYDFVRGKYSPFLDHADDAKERAYARWRSAVLAVRADQRDVVITSSCYDIMPEDGAGLRLLERGLEILSAHYGLAGKDDSSVLSAVEAEIVRREDPTYP